MDTVQQSLSQQPSNEAKCVGDACEIMPNSTEQPREQMDYGQQPGPGNSVMETGQQHPSVMGQLPGYTPGAAGQGFFQRYFSRLTTILVIVAVGLGLYWWWSSKGGGQSGGGGTCGSVSGNGSGNGSGNDTGIGNTITQVAQKVANVAMRQSQKLPPHF